MRAKIVYSRMSRETKGLNVDKYNWFNVSPLRRIFRGRRQPTSIFAALLSSRTPLSSSLGPLADVV